MRKLAVVCALLLTASLSSERALAQSQQAIPPSFFGIHVNNPRIANGGTETSYPLQVTYGEFRNWDVYQVSWPDIETCEAATPVILTDKCFGPNHDAGNCKPLQYELQQLNSAGVSNVLSSPRASRRLHVKCRYGTFYNCPGHAEGIRGCSSPVDG